MLRTNTCGELTTKDLDKEVTLCGWVNTRRDHGGVIFIDLRDRYGMTQIVFNPDQKDFAQAEKLRREDVIQANGKIRRRPEGMTNPNLPTGEIEVVIKELEVLNKAETPPLEVDDRIIASEEMRLKYRYLDLRRPIMQKHLIARHKAAQAAREYLNSLGFLEIETPMLMKHTPEGARDYVVPSRVHPGKFYSLPQSPQLYKQILMVSGLDRYYQLARCLRDEDLRADRQPEFTQIDLEMTFVEQDDIFRVTEGLIKHIVKKTINKDLDIPFKRFSYNEAMSRFGSDKPDLRFGMELIDVTEIAVKCDFNVFKNAENIKVIVTEKDLPRKDIDSMIDFAMKEGAKGLAWMRMGESGKLESNIVKFFPEETQKKLIEKVKPKKGQIIFFMSDKEEKVNQVLGKVRLELARRFELLDNKRLEFCWIADFPMFKWNEEDERWEAEHHIFTMPNKEHLDYLPDFPGKVHAQCYDLVLNGVEMASGSIRIHRADIQEKMLAVIGMTKEQAEMKFGFLLEAFRYGAPPHGGIAPGFDRLVAMLLGYNDIREVIAFPKSKSAEGLMDSCPSELDDTQYKELHLKSTFRKEKVKVFEEIEKMLSNNDIRFEVIEHLATFTSEESAKARGTRLDQGAKAMVMKADSKPIMVVVQASKAIDEEKLKSAIGAKGVKMARADEVKQLMDCDIGSVHPFGNMAGLKVYVDEGLLKEDEIAFNAGSHTTSIKMKSADYRRVVEPIVGRFAK